SLFAGKRAQLVADNAQLEEALLHASAPDALLPRDVGFVHRKLDSADIYFLANTSNHLASGHATFRDSRRTSQWWDPFTGRSVPAGGRRVELDLAPYESRVLVFSDAVSPSPPLRAERTGSGTDISSGWTVAFPGSPPVALDQLDSWTNLPDRYYFSGV